MNKAIGYVLLVGALAVVGYSLFKSGKFDGVQPAPVNPPSQNNNAAQIQQWRMWVTMVMQIFGNVQDLWQPGGPFYNYNYTDVIDYVDPNIDTTPIDWEPESGDYGWA
jgi:hypothetical protein